MTNLELKLQAKNLGMASFHIAAFSMSLDVIRCARLATLSQHQKDFVIFPIDRLAKISDELDEIDEELQNIAGTLDEHGITKEV